MVPTNRGIQTLFLPLLQRRPRGRLLNLRGVIRTEYRFHWHGAVHHVFDALSRLHSTHGSGQHLGLHQRKVSTTMRWPAIMTLSISSRTVVSMATLPA